MYSSHCSAQNYTVVCWNSGKWAVIIISHISPLAWSEWSHGPEEVSPVLNDHLSVNFCSSQNVLSFPGLSWHIAALWNIPHFVVTHMILSSGMQCLLLLIIEFYLVVFRLISLVSQDHFEFKCCLLGWFWPPSWSRLNSSVFHRLEKKLIILLS